MARKSQVPQNSETVIYTLILLQLLSIKMLSISLIQLILYLCLSLKLLQLLRGMLRTSFWAELID